MCRSGVLQARVDENVQKVPQSADLIRSWLGTGFQRPVMKLHRVTSGQSRSPQDNQTPPQANLQSQHKTCANVQGKPPPFFFPPSNRKTDKQ